MHGHGSHRTLRRVRACFLLCSLFSFRRVSPRVRCVPQQQSIQYAFYYTYSRDRRRCMLSRQNIAPTRHTSHGLRLSWATCWNGWNGSSKIFFFEEKRILRRKRTGTPDHTRDSHSATKRERDVDTAKLKAGGVLTGGRLGPLQGGPRAKAKCGAGRAKRGGAGCS